MVTWPINSSHYERIENKTQEQELAEYLQQEEYGMVHHLRQGVLQTLLLGLVRVEDGPVPA